MKLLLEDYKRKQNTIKEKIEADDVTEETLNRLKVKQGMINSFIVDIHAAMARSSDENSGLHIADVNARFTKEQSHEVRKLCRDFYLWMQANDYDHNIPLRVENKAELFLRDKNVR